MVSSIVCWTFVLGVICCPSFGQTADTCTKINSCSCKNSKGVIDLSPLNTGTPPRFKDVPSTDAGGNQFSWNPCAAFSEGDGSCTNVAVCQVQEGLPRNYIRIGLPGTASFVTGSQGILELQYSASFSGVLRTSHVTLECDPDSSPGVFTAHGEDPIRLANYYMTYRGMYACAIDPDVGGISAGSILCIIFFSLILLYLCLGILYQICFKKVSGREIIPQYSFWSTLPGLVQSCQVQTGSPKSYFSIGTQNSASFVTDNNGGLKLQYTSTTDFTRTTYLTLVCDASQDPGTFTAAGEDPSVQATYDLTYTGIYACPLSLTTNSTSSSVPTSTTYSPGPTPTPLCPLQYILAIGIILLACLCSFLPRDYLTDVSLFFILLACVCLGLVVIIMIFLCRRNTETTKPKDSGSKHVNYQTF